MEKLTPEYVRSYVLHGLAATPHTFDTLLTGITDSELDARPDPVRFTLREVVAHMADWEGIWLVRIRRIATEDTPTLPGYDEGQWAIDHDYAHSDYREQLDKLASGRAQLVEYLRSLDGATWNRAGDRPEVGRMTIFEMAAMVLGHDGYHVRQILDYRGLGGDTAA